MGGIRPISPCSRGWFHQSRYSKGRTPAARGCATCLWWKPWLNVWLTTSSAITRACHALARRRRPSSPPAASNTVCTPPRMAAVGVVGEGHRQVDLQSGGGVHALARGAEVVVEGAACLPSTVPRHVHRLGREPGLRPPLRHLTSQRGGCTRRSDRPREVSWMSHV